MSIFLFDDHPIVANKVLAKEIGLYEALVLQQVNYWIEINKRAGKNYFDGKYWTYNSIKSWQEKDFNYLSVDSVRRTFASLEKQGYLISGNYNKDARNKTKWYTINDDKLFELYQEIELRKKQEEEKILEEKEQLCVKETDDSLDFNDEISDVDNFDTANHSNCSIWQKPQMHLANTQMHLANSTNACMQKPQMYSNKDFYKDFFHTSSRPPVTSNLNTDLGRMEGREEIEPKKINKSYEDYLTDLKIQINFDCLKNMSDRKSANEILSILADVFVLPDTASVMINQESLPASIVKKRYSMLNLGHIQYLSGLIQNPEYKIKNIRSFILTCAYNAPSSVDAYYAALVAQDKKDGKI